METVRHYGPADYYLRLDIEIAERTELSTNLAAGLGSSGFLSRRLRQLSLP